MATNYETKQAAYEAEIEPLMNQIFDLCTQHKINHAALFQLDNEGGETGFASQRVFDQDNLRGVAPELVAITMISKESAALAVGVINAVNARCAQQSAEENPHGIAD